MECKRDLSITNVVEMKYLHFVRDAVYAYAHALQAMHRQLCPEGSGVCPEMRQQMRNQLTGYIANATFEGRSNFLSFKQEIVHSQIGCTDFKSSKRIFFRFFGFFLDFFGFFSGFFGFFFRFFRIFWVYEDFTN